jgi:hypothetical protein
MDKMETIPQIKLESSLNLSKIEPDKKSGVFSENNNEEKKEKPQKMKRIKFFKLKFNLKLSKRKKKYLLGIGGGFAVIILLLVVFLGFPAYRLYKQGMLLKTKAFELKASMGSQDINIVEGKLNEFEVELNKFDKNYNRLAWVRVVPWAGGYWKDGRAGINASKHGIDTAKIMITTIKPYADIIGFAGGGEASSGEESANDRIEFLVQTVGEILPQMDAIIQNAQMTKDEIDKINPNRYPEKFRGVEVRSKLKQAIEMTDEGLTMLTNSKPLMEAAPYLLGTDDTRTYLMLFQNDKELRPTGGFITAYSIMDMTNGKVQPVISSDIYTLDNNYKPSIEAPEVYRQYIGGIYEINNKFRLRDMNWNPDFEKSMDMFMSEAKKAGIEKVDGVIAVDTYVVTSLLDVIGPIGVPGFGNFSTEIVPECDCPQVVYELENFADQEGPVVWSENEPGKIVYAPANYDNRKKIIGPLMNSLLSNTLGQEKGKLPALFEAGWKDVTEKHVLLYMFDEKAQEGVTKFNLAGKIRDYNGDYLHINNANLGGRKSNLYMNYEATLDVTKAKDGSITNTLTITYKNPKEQDGWLNSVLPNWTRVYVPEGSELIESDGFEVKADPYNEDGKTVFAGGFELRPMGVAKITFKYKLPNKINDGYNLLIQKQPGIDGPLYTINYGKKTEELYLKTDKELKFGVLKS